MSKRTTNPDGSTVERTGYGQTVIRDRDGKVLENSRPTSSTPIRWIGNWDRQVTTDGDGNIINVQKRNP